MKRILSKKRGLEIINNFPASKVLVVGDIMVDHFIWGKVIADFAGGPCTCRGSSIGLALAWGLCQCIE